MSDTPEIVDFDKAPPMPVEKYDDTVSRFIPGYEAIFEMVLAYLRATLPDQANVLIVGAGSGKELVKFGLAMPGWSLTGVDPSGQMLAIARQKITSHNLGEQVELHQGFVSELPATRQFQAATSILVMHFLPDNGAKLDFLMDIAARLQPGANLLMVDGYGEQEFVNQWMPAWHLQAQQMGISAERMQPIEKVQRGLYTISEGRTQELLEQAGFENFQRFYTAFYYSGWIANLKAV